VILATTSDTPSLLSQSAFSSYLKLWQDKKEQLSAQHKLYVFSFDHAQIKVASRSFRLSSHLFFPADF
jgi:hypothetical protein